ncbi:MAG: type II toxin-antitoxin system VapC family toxin [Treponema sp.]|nr:type II toxin-antitoxin system VapC family toxin [Treponema sp.]
MNYVFDVSFVGALIIPDEIEPHSQKMYARVKNEDERHVPLLFWYEISNIFNNLILRKRYTYNEIIDFFSYLDAFCFLTDFESGIIYSRKLLQLCNDYGLSAYDAAYLELADRKKAVLFTFDSNLKIATEKKGVNVLSSL